MSLTYPNLPVNVVYSCSSIKKSLKELTGFYLAIDLLACSNSQSVMVVKFYCSKEYSLKTLSLAQKKIPGLLSSVIPSPLQYGHSATLLTSGINLTFNETTQIFT